jgi:regulator of sirC expression with transglutaminase-like and TPR domain
MDQPATASSVSQASASQRAALLTLLTDDDPAIYRIVRQTIVASGPQASEWLRPHVLSNDPLLRRRAREIVEHFARQEADVRFLGFCLKHGEVFDLEQGAWLLAATEYPFINILAYRAVLDEYAAELRERLEAADRAVNVLGVINHFLFEDLGFTGNEANYYDPDNNYMNCVLDRRTGNPVSLCLLYMLLARRLRLPVAGISLPGHFICRYQSSSDEVYLDVFHHGKLLTKADCVHYLQQGNHALQEDFLAPVSARRLLLRICSNLHQIYLQFELAEEATRVQRYRVALAK